MKTKQRLLSKAFLRLLLFVFGCTSLSYAQPPGIKLTGDSCRTLTVAFSLTNSQASTVFWHFNDPASEKHDTLTTTGNGLAFHSFFDPGTYNVCAYFQEPGKPPDSVCRNFDVGICCNGGMKVQGDCITNVVNFFLQTGAMYSEISWDFGDPTSGNRNKGSGQSVYHVFLAPGNFKVTATVKASCGNFVVSKTVTVRDCQLAPVCSGNIVSGDTCLESGTSFTISSRDSIRAIRWNFDDTVTGAQNQSNLVNTFHQFSKKGVYRVQAIVEFACGADTLYKSVTISGCNKPATCVIDFANKLSCRGKPSQFSLVSDNSIASVAWNFGDPTSGAGNTSNLAQAAHVFSSAGTYIVTAIALADCGSDTLQETVRIDNCPDTTVCKVIMPNAFSPNGDGTNDQFAPKFPCITERLDWMVFNRWGQMVFHGRSVSDKWNGMMDGKPLADGVYYFTMRYKTVGGPENNRSGSIMLLR